jgi:hypothetical protein
VASVLLCLTAPRLTSLFLSGIQQFQKDFGCQAAGSDVGRAWGMQVGPRMSFQSAWSTNAVSICRSCGLDAVARLEVSRRFLLRCGARQQLPPEATVNFAALVRPASVDDIMLQSCLGAAWQATPWVLYRPGSHILFLKLAARPRHGGCKIRTLQIFSPFKGCRGPASRFLIAMILEIICPNWRRTGSPLCACVHAARLLIVWRCRRCTTA